jgi:hypothetical protein
LNEAEPTVDEVVALITADLIATLGWSHDQAEAFARRRFVGLDAVEAAEVLYRVEMIQQNFHDDRVDTSWPRCPDHPNHPLRLSEKLPATWTCPLTSRPVCPLGRLSTRSI